MHLPIFRESLFHSGNKLGLSRRQGAVVIGYVDNRCNDLSVGWKAFEDSSASSNDFGTRSSRNLVSTDALSLLAPIVISIAISIHERRVTGAPVRLTRLRNAPRRDAPRSREKSGRVLSDDQSF